MIRDALSQFQFTTASGLTATADKVGAAIAGAGTYFTDAIDTKTGGFGQDRAITVAVIFNAATNASGSNAVTITEQVSDDGTTYYDNVTDTKNAINLSTTAQKGTANLKVASNRRYHRLKIVISGAGSTPVITIKSASLTPATA